MISTRVVVGIAIGGITLLVIVVLTLMCFLRKKKRRRYDDAPPPKAGDPYDRDHQNASRPSDHVVTSLLAPKPPSPLPRSYSCGFEREKGRLNNSDHSVLPPPSPGLALGIYKSTFTYEELSRATSEFSQANLLGQGGFGYVYKGILPNGKEIAVKQLKAGSGQGDTEFMAEINIISRIHHKHLVSLVGYYADSAQRLLVFEFLPNNDLEFHLHRKGRPPMEWRSRLKIAIGSAKGLSFLHETCYPKIIHRDIKAANILIDSNFEAKVADFGLARIGSETNTHVSTRVMGTFGYLAPEYAASGHLSEKSDVYSFGVVLLELITGRRPVCPVDSNNVYSDGSLVDWARPLLIKSLEESNFEVLADIKLNNEYDKEEMARMVACAAACVRYSAPRRPRMEQVARALEGNVLQPDPNEGIKRGHSHVNNSYDTSRYNVSSEYSNPNQ